MGLGSGAGLEIEAGSGLDGFEKEGSGEEGVDDLAGEEEEGEDEEEEGEEEEVERGEVEEGTGVDEGEGEGMYYDGSFYNENEDADEAMRLAGIRLGTYYQQGEGEEGLVRLVGVEGVEGVESMEGLPLEVDRDEEGEGVVEEEEVLTNLDDGDNDNDFMIMKTTPLPEPIEILSPTLKKTPSEQPKTPRTTPRFSPPPPPPPPVPAIGPLFVRDGDAEWLVLTTDTVLADPLLRKYLPSQRRPYSFRLPLPLPFHTPR